MNNQIQLVLKSSTTELSLNNHELGIYLVPELEGFTGLPEIRTTSGVNAGYDGGWTSAQNYDARSITIRGVIANENIATVEQLRRQLTTLAGQGKNEELTLDLVTQAGKAYTVQARTIALEMALQKVLCQQEFMLQLRADDPLIYDGGTSGESVIVQVQKAIGGFQIDFELPLAISGGSGESTINNGGLEQVYPIIKMYGALHNPTFVNQTTNQQFQVNATLGFADGAWHTPSELYKGTTINIQDAPDNAPLSSFQLDGETSQNGTPTPSAPQAVNTTTGENVVKICGKNLFDVANAQMTVARLNSAGNITTGVTNRLCTLGYIEVKPNTAYTLSATPEISGKTLQAYIVGYSESGSGTSIGNYPSNAWYGFPITFTTGSNCKYIRVSYRYSDDSDMAATSATNQQLELGSATAYEPYQGQSYEVNLGKNLFDKDLPLSKTYYTNTGATATYTKDQFINFTLTPTSRSLIMSYSARHDQQQGSAIAANVRILQYNSSGAFISRLMSRDNNHVFSLDSNTTRILVCIDAGEDAYFDNLQLEYGSSATSYAAYFEPIELCKIGDYQDYIYKSGGKWYRHKAVGKITLDGSETWHFLNDGGTFKRYYTDSYSSSVQGLPETTGGLSDHFGYAGVVSGADVVGKIYFNKSSGTNYANGNITVTISGLASTADAIDDWMTSNNTTFYYALATPTDTEITNEALIAQLEAVLGGHTYAGTNNIFTVTPNEQGTLEICYMTEKDADKRDVMVIDSRMRTVTLNGADIYHLITSGSEFPMLAPGENKLLLRSDTPGDNGYADVNYKQGYLTI